MKMNYLFARHMKMMMDILYQFHSLKPHHLQNLQQPGGIR